MHIITNHIHYVTKINQAFPIFLVYSWKTWGGLGTRLVGNKTSWERSGCPCSWSSSTTAAHLGFPTVHHSVTKLVYFLCECNYVGVTFHRIVLQPYRAKVCVYSWFPVEMSNDSLSPPAPAELWVVNFVAMVTATKINTFGVMLYGKEYSCRLSGSCWVYAIANVVEYHNCIVKCLQWWLHGRKSVVTCMAVPVC